MPTGKTLTLTLPGSDTTQFRARSFGKMETFLEQRLTGQMFGTCTKEAPKDPKSVPLKKCSYSRPQPVFKREDLIQSENLIRRVAKAIQSIEEGNYGRVDTLGGEWECNTYHFHALIRLHNVKSYDDELGKGKKRGLIIRLMEKNPQDVVLLYHTEEWTNRFPSYSPNRNLVDWGNGDVLTHGSPTCDGLYASDINCRNVAGFKLAIIPPEHELYSFGHILPDGRRFVIWFGN